MRPRLITAERVAFLLIAAGLLAAGRGRMMRDPGTFWHTVVGTRMLDGGTLPRVDSFTFTHAGRPWIAQQWLAECFMALLHRVGGLDALLLAAAILLAATHAFVFARLTRAGIAWPLAALLIALVLAAGSYHFLARPHLFTIALTAVLYARLCDHDAGRAPPGRLWRLAPLFLLWTNLHGGALGGLATLALAWIGWTVRPARGIECPVPGAQYPGVVARSWSHSSPAEWKAESPFTFRRPGALLLLACLATPLLNPYGLDLPRVWLALMRSDVLPRVIQEHAPPSLAAPETWMLAALAAIYVVALAAADPARRRAIHLIPLAWGVLAAMRIRHGPLFAVMVPIALAELLPDSRIDRWLRARGSDLLSPPPHLDPPRSAASTGAARIAPLACALLTLGLLLQSAGVRVPLLGADWARLDPAYWPVNGLPQLRAVLNERPDRPNVFNDTLFGGFLIYFAPRARIFIDDRCELYGDEGLRDYVALAARPERLRARLDAADVRIALVIPGTSFDRWFAAQPDWRRRYADAAAHLYARE